MRRGTRVGQAYVALTVDGSGINDQIADEIQDIDYDKIGREANGDFRSGWNHADRARAKELVDNAGRDMKEAVERASRAVEHDTTIGRAIRTQLKDAFNKGDLDSFIEATGKHVGYKFGSGFDRQFKEAVLNALNEAQQEAAKHGGKYAATQGGKEGLNLFATDERGMLRTTREFDRIAESAHRAVERYNADWDEAIKERFKRERDSDEAIWKVRRASAKAYDQYLRLLEKGRIDKRTGRDIPVSGNGRDNDLGSRIGRMFGAGSRNNFLNLFGRSIGGSVKAVFALRKAADSMFSTFMRGFNNAGENAKLFTRILSGGSALGSSLMSRLAASGPAAAVSIGVVTVALSVMASVIGSLIGLVTALASTIVSALVGALAVTGGLLASVTAAAGLLTAAFMSMTDAQKKMMAEAFTPLRQQMVGIGQLMLQEMIPAFSTWASNLQRALMLTVPAAQRMGQAFAQAGNILTASLSGPGFQRFAQMMTVYLPGITTNLSMALGNFLNGLMGLFAAITPAVARFSSYLSDVALRFSNWANSAQGNNAITGFVDRALSSLRSLWGFVSSFFSFVSAVLFSPEAMNAGNTIFDGIAAKFREFTEYVRQAQANGDLQRWFDDAIEFGTRLWEVIEALGGTFMALYNSGVINAVADVIGFFADAVEKANKPLKFFVDKVLPLVPDSLGAIVPAAGFARIGINAMTDSVGENAERAKGYMTVWGGVAQGIVATTSAMAETANVAMNQLHSAYNTASSMSSQYSNMASIVGPSPSMGSLVSSGQSALAQTSIPKPKTPKKFHNPWKAWANSLIKSGPGIMAEVRAATRKLNAELRSALGEIAKTEGRAPAVDAINSAIKQAKSAMQSTVDRARSELNSAAQSLANASNMGDARRALREVQRAQKGLNKALKDQRKLNAQMNVLAKQRRANSGRIAKLLAGEKVSNATLADYAYARERVAKRLEDAKAKLAEAIALRDNYSTQIADSIKAFGSLMTAQAKVIDGVEQQLTAADITGNLRDRLDKIKAFQNNLRLLLAQGLSNEAYKQIMDAGVEEGGAFAEALLGGGIGAVQETNALLAQIGSMSKSMGAEASSRLYQAGVDAAKGLVDGLTSLSAQLDSAATKLGNSIAAAVKRALGIKSPSRVLMGMMDQVGDGAVIGLENQASKLRAASEAFGSNIGISPAVSGNVAASAAAMAGAGGQRPIELTVVTPTKDPHAVAMETVNELVGRL